MRNPRIQKIQLDATWYAFGYRIASIGGALVGLLSLLAGATVSVASLRGVGLWLILVLVAALGRWLLDKSFPEIGEEGPGYEFDPRDLV